jgi:hypothetical protein
MRFLAALIFFVTMPVVVFFATVIYGGINGSSIKQELVKANLYDTITGPLKTAFVGSDTDTQDPSASEITALIQNRLTQSYIQNKTETFIDDTGDWLQNKTTTPPVISFHEIKDDIIAKNPGLIDEIDKSFNEMKKQQTEQSSTDTTDGSSPDTAAMNKEMESFHNLMKSDFSIPVGRNLLPLKQAYQTIHIALPILAILLIACIAALVLLNKTSRSKLLWVSITLIISALYGFLIVFTNGAIFALAKQALVDNSNALVDSFSPIATSMLGLFDEQYKHYQFNINIIFLTVGAICFILSFILHSPPAIETKKKPSPKKK